MTRRVLKFGLLAGTSEIETADEPRWLAAGWQGDNLVVWCEATPGAGVRRAVAAVPTGSPTPTPDEHAVYVGTAMHPTLLDGKPLVVHVYAQES